MGAFALIFTLGTTFLMVKSIFNYEVTLAHASEGKDSKYLSGSDKTPAVVSQYYSSYKYLG